VEHASAQTSVTNLRDRSSISQRASTPAVKRQIAIITGKGNEQMTRELDRPTSYYKPRLNKVLKGRERRIVPRVRRLDDSVLKERSKPKV